MAIRVRGKGKERVLRVILETIGKIGRYDV